MPVQLREVKFLLPDSNQELEAVRLDLDLEDDDEGGRHHPIGPYYEVGGDPCQCVEGCGWGGGQLSAEQDLLACVNSKLKLPISMHHSTFRSHYTTLLFQIPSIFF